LEEKKLVAPELVTLFRNGRDRMAILALLTLVSLAAVLELEVVKRPD